MRAKNRAWLAAIILIVLVAFWVLFQTPRMMPKEEYAPVYYSYSFEKPLATESERTKNQIFKEIETALGKEDLFGVKVTIPTKNELKVRVDLLRPEDIPATQEKVTKVLQEVLRDEDGRPRFGAMKPGEITDDFPPRPIFRLGRLAFYPLQAQIKRGLDLQGGTHLVLQVRQQNTLLEYQLAPTPEAVAEVLKKEAPGTSKAEENAPKPDRSAAPKAEPEAKPEKEKEAAPPDEKPAAEEESSEKKETASPKGSGSTSSEKEAAPAEKKKLGREELDQLVAEVEKEVRHLLIQEGLGHVVRNNQVVEEYPVDVIGGNIVQIRTQSKGEEQRKVQAQRLLGALHKRFPAVELISQRTLELPPDPVHEVREIIRRRIDKLGIAEPLIQRQGQDRIIVEMPGIKDPEEAIAMLGTTAQLEFRKVPEKYRPEVKRGPEGREATIFLDKDGTEVPTEVVFHEGEQVLYGTDLKAGSAVVGFDQFQKPTVNLALTDEGARKFDEFAKKNYHKYLAIYLDRECISAPRMEARHFGGKVQISGGFESVEEANELKILLNAGALPVPVDVVEQRTVSATLGADSVKRSYLSGFCGLLAVALVMITFYRLPGVIASGALLIYCLLVLAAMAGLHATLTLPGIFGFILSIGMAVDANVIIFERFKEELRSGKTLRSAIQAGFERAWAAILDGNVTTLLIAAVLYLMGTGPIKGFAVTLFLGNVISLFSAVTVTRLLMNLAASTRLGNRREMYGV